MHFLFSEQKAGRSSIFVYNSTLKYQVLKCCRVLYPAQVAHAFTGRAFQLQHACCCSQPGEGSQPRYIKSFHTIYNSDNPGTKADAPGLIPPRPVWKPLSYRPIADWLGFVLSQPASSRMVHTPYRSDPCAMFHVIQGRQIPWSTMICTAYE